MPLHRRSVPLASLAAILLAAPLVVACSATSSDDGASEAASSDSAITGSVAVSSRLVTTTRVNLRETPSQATQDNIITVMPKGATVTVLSATPTSGFYNVDYEGQEGWAYGAFLVADGGSGGGGGGGSSCYDSALGSKLVSASREVDGEGSQGLCYRYVKNHIEEAGIPIRSIVPAAYEESAYKFAVWAKSDPAGLAAAHFAPSSVGLDALPLGAILVWRAGQCGYSAEHGHIEINIGGGRACSDFCGHIKRDCGMPSVFVPTKSDCR